MTQAKEKTPKLSAAILRTIQAYGFLKTPIEMGLINYSALARKIRPALEKQLQERLTVEAIAMALHRHVKTDADFQKPSNLAALGVIAQCKVHILSDMSTSHYPYDRKLQEKLHQAKAIVEHQGGNLYVIERANEITIITQNQYRAVVSRLTHNAKTLDDYRNVSVLTVQYPTEGVKQPGVFKYLVRALSDAGVNLLGVFSSYSKISFVIADADAPAAYDGLTRAIQNANTMQ
ncbi:ACT domain-containing protein [Candidatus Micrarchaeota archaeon]|nr:ACT domain-containing protein [Candidatus Micrarchaeota archaeon]